MRFLISDREDIRRTINVMVAIAMVNAFCMIFEQRTGTNLFAITVGGMPEEVFRDGKVRSNGAFESFLTAGAFGATLVPLLVWLWSQGKSKMITILGLLSATVMTVTCYTSTSVVAYAAGVLGLCLWPIRNQMRLIRWGIVVALVALHVCMHGPVWSLIERIDLTGSSSSYHRYMLIDNFVRHFGDWWLIGTKDNGSWGFDMWDTCNEYVQYAFSGGLLAFVLFVSIISRGFSKLGTARKLAEGKRTEEWFVWCVGAALLSHVIGFLGTNYMDQMMFAWLVLLAIIPAAVFEVMGSVVPKVQEALTPSYAVHAASSRVMQIAKQ
jgi:hypothetical protein